MPPKRGRPARRTTTEPPPNPPPVGQMDPVLVQLFQTLTQQTAALAQQQQQFQQQLLTMQQQQQPQQQPHQQQQHAPQAPTFKAFQSVQPPEFKGTPDPVGAQSGLKEIEKAFALAQIPENKKTDYASYFLKNEANYWWESIKALEATEVIIWDRFKEMFLEKYFPAYMTDQMELKFLELKQGNMSVAEYETKFTELSRFVPTYVDTERKRARRFQQGLKSWIRSK